MKRFAMSLARHRTVSISTACQCLYSDRQAADATPVSSERSTVKRAKASSDSGGVSGYEGGRRERKRSTLSLPTVSAPEELQKALKKVLEGETPCRHPPIVGRMDGTSHECG